MTSFPSRPRPPARPPARPHALEIASRTGTNYAICSGLTLQWLILHTTYNTSPKYCRSDALWSIFYIDTRFDAKCLKTKGVCTVASGNCPKCTTAKIVTRVRVENRMRTLIENKYVTLAAHAHRGLMKLPRARCKIGMRGHYDGRQGFSKGGGG